MWLVSTFALVFLGFIITTGIATAGVTWAAYRGSWRLATIALVGAAGTAILVGVRVATRVSFASTYLPETATFWLLTIMVAGGAGALWMRTFTPGEPSRRLVVPLALTFVLWCGFALVLGGGSACNLDSECY
jgi:hypothetical protein